MNKEQLIGATFELDLGLLHPVSVEVIDLTDYVVTVKYKNSTPNRIEEFSIFGFKKLTGIKIDKI